MAAVEGNISASSEFVGTLDEPIKDTIMRDLHSIYKKLRYVLLPRSRSESGAGLKQWDLWGPLLLCLTLSVILYIEVGLHYKGKDIDKQQKLVFTMVYVIVWIGSFVVTLNAQLLGGKVSFFQSTCVLGYCIFPLDIAAIICIFIPLYLKFIKLIINIIALHWATGASVAFMSEMVAEEKKVLAVYPVWLFYVAIACIICLV